jgi:hypothetical protein
MLRPEVAEFTTHIMRGDDFGHRWEYQHPLIFFLKGVMLMDETSYELTVTFGKAWNKLIGVSLGLGLVVTVGTFFAGRMVFVDTFKQTAVVPTNK